MVRRRRRRARARARALCCAASHARLHPASPHTHLAIPQESLNLDDVMRRKDMILLT